MGTNLLCVKNKPFFKIYYNPKDFFQKRCVPSWFFVLPQSHFISALTVVFVNSKSLSSLKIDDTPVDDPSLKVLVANNSDTLKLLKMSSCPHVSPAGTVRGAEIC